MSARPSSDKGSGRGPDRFWWFVVAVLVLGLTIAVVQPFFEARAYEHVTGAKVSYWDACWLDLRVQESPK